VAAKFLSYRSAVTSNLNEAGVHDTKAERFRRKAQKSDRSQYDKTDLSVRLGIGS